MTATTTSTGPEHGTERPLSFASPHEEVLLNLLRTSDAVDRNFLQRLKPFGLSGPQYNVLRILRGAHPAGLTCSAIGRSMITPEPDTTRLLARLKAQKFLSQQRDTHDRRILWNCITEDGLHVLANLDGIVERAPREIFSQLNGEELRELSRLLVKVRCRGKDLAVSDVIGSEMAGSGAERSEKAALPTGKPPLQHLRRQQPAHPHPPE